MTFKLLSFTFEFIATIVIRKTRALRLTVIAAEAQIQSASLLRSKTYELDSRSPLSRRTSFAGMTGAAAGVKSQMTPVPIDKLPASEGRRGSHQCGPYGHGGARFHQFLGYHIKHSLSRGLFGG